MASIASILRLVMGVTACHFSLCKMISGSFDSRLFSVNRPASHQCLLLHGNPDIPSDVCAPTN